MDNRDSQVNNSNRSASSYLWSDSIFADPVRSRSLPASLVVGVLEGEGIGPDVVNATLRVLRALESTGRHNFEVSFGGPIGTEAESRYGEPLPNEVVEFCRSVFSQGGAILAGPGGGRFVYDLRKRFDLFCKLSPLRASDELIDASRIKSDYIRGVDILLVRENTSGIYQGRWNEISTPGEGRKAEQSFFYTEKQVRRILEVAARIASQRRGNITVVLKEGGIPAISGLWRDCAIEVASEVGVDCSLVNVDYAVYRLIQDPRELDVVVTPNLFGDVLADLGGVLLGSRGVSFSGNISRAGAAVYQTNHGAAYDLVGKNQANPAGQIFSLAMLLRESFGLIREAKLVEDAVAGIWSQGWRTADLAEKGCSLVGTKEMGELITEALIRLNDQAEQIEAR
jgi:3-isopropylmalate dehydrogenase